MHGGQTQRSLHCRLAEDPVGAATLIIELSFRMRESNDGVEEPKVRAVLLLSSDGFEKATIC